MDAEETCSKEELFPECVGCQSKRMGCDFWGSDNILFVDLGIESVDVFTL